MTPQELAEVILAEADGIDGDCRVAIYDPATDTSRHITAAMAWISGPAGDRTVVLELETVEWGAL